MIVKVERSMRGNLFTFQLFVYFLQCSSLFTLFFHRLNSIDKRYQELQELARLRKQRLLDALSLYKLFTEADGVEQWINEKEKMLITMVAGKGLLFTFSVVCLHFFAKFFFVKLQHELISRNFLILINLLIFNDCLHFRHRGLRDYEASFRWF